MQPRLDGAMGHAQVVGDLVIAPVFGVFQQQQLGVSRRESRDRLPHKRLRLFSHQPGERIVNDGFVSRYAVAGVALDESPSPTRTSAIL